MAEKEIEIPKESLGSPQAMSCEEFSAHYRTAFPSLHLIASGIIGDRTHACDIVQEAFVVALKKSHEFVPNTSFVAWLSEIVRRLSLNYCRKVRGRKTTVADPDLLAQNAEQSESNRSSYPISQESGELVEFQDDFDDKTMQALMALGTDARCCLLLRVLQNLSYAEISEVMQIPEGTAMSHVHRSKRHLRESLRAQTSTPEEDKKSK